MDDIFKDLKYQFQKRDNVLIQLILINIAVFLVINIFMIFGPDVVDAVIRTIFYIPISFEYLLYRPWTLFTHFFSHKGLFHILFNMLMLYWFGRIIHEFLGGRRLLNLYLLGGIVGGISMVAIIELLPHLENHVGIGGFNYGIGASGAVTAIVVAAATLVPDYQFSLIFIGPVKIKYIAWFVIILSFLQVSGSNSAGNIAHLGGGLLGYIFIKQLQNGRDLGRPINKIIAFFSSLGKPKMKVSYKQNKKTAPTQPKKENVDQAEIDRILDKIADSGYESLSKAEKEKLFKASEK